MDYWPYDVTHVLAQLQLLFFSALAFVWLNKAGLYPPELHSVNIDVEWLYRRLLPATAGLVRGAMQRAAQTLARQSRRATQVFTATKVHARLEAYNSPTTGRPAAWCFGSP